MIADLQSVRYSPSPQLRPTRRHLVHTVGEYRAAPYASPRPPRRSTPWYRHTRRQYLTPRSKRIARYRRQYRPPHSDRGAPYPVSVPGTV
eukprot:1373337-Rhodomonas_salina.1